MELFHSGFKVFGGKMHSPWRSRTCLRPPKLFIVIFFGVFIAGIIQGSYAESYVFALEGSTATLNCTNISSGSTFNWSRMDEGQNKDIQQNKSLLVFPSVNRTMAGVYVCTHYANGSILRNDTLRLVVQYPAEVTRVLPSSSIEIKPGEDKELSCTISAVPAISTVNWTIINGDLVQVSNKTNYTISNANCSNTGKYRCIPSNGIGSNVAKINGTFGTFNVKVRDQPGQVNISLVTCSRNVTSLTFHWSAPSNGCLPLNYTILYDNNQSVNVGNNLSGTITGLRPNTEYKVRIRTENAKGFADSDRRSFWTVPSAPLSLRTSAPDCPANVTWDKPSNESAANITYRLSYGKFNSSINWTHIENINRTHYSIQVQTVRFCSEVQCSYNIKVTANSSAGYGDESNVTQVYCDIRSSPNRAKDNPYLLIVYIVLVIIFLAIVLIIAAICLRGKCQSCKMPFKGLLSIDQVPNENAPMTGEQSSFKEKRDREAVPYEKFWQHVTLRHADSNYRFSSAFESLQGIQQKNKKITWTQSQRPENHTKNRFANVVAYDQTRVVLSTIDGIPGSHYINANYVDSYKAMNFYIATQGPLANTIADFWRMVWEQNSRVIVMITKIIEKGRHKCAQYWPTKNRKSDDHGPLRVTFLREEHFAFYTLREFELKPIKEGTHYSQDSSDEAIKPMIVQQFHFTGWPDHGVPDPGYEIPVLDFILKSTAAQVEGAGPIIVHCSAGVGRSGAFIVIDSMIKRIHDNGDLNIFSFLAHIRQQRNHLVQEECQYIFVHDVLLEYINCGFLLSLPKRALKEHVYKIRTQPHHTGNTKIVVEFERLMNINIQEYNLKEGQRACNVSRSRNPNIMPVDTCRVKLYPRPGVEGSDYINASYIDGFWRREAYIATQCPLESTQCDFWRMIWQENCRSIVMLLSKEEADQSSYPRYLPVVHDTARFGLYEVTMESESARGDFMIRDLKMTSVNEPGETRQLRHFHFLHWPEEGFPWSGQSVLQLVSKVDEWEKEVRSNAKPFDMIGPIVVHCSTGVGRTGMYCILHTLWHQVTKEDVVSVYPTARLHFHQRPKFLLTQAQYEFCYDTMVEYIDADCSLYLV